MDANWLATAYQDMMRRRMMENQQAAKYMADLGPSTNSAKSLGGLPRIRPGSFDKLPLDPKWDELPSSSNVEDRRNEPSYLPIAGQLLYSLTGGLNLDDLYQSFRHPMTPVPSRRRPQFDASHQMQSDFGADRY